METLLKPSYCDVITDNRNKSFGQYELRTRYPDRILRASICVITSIATLTIGGIWLTPELKADNNNIASKPEMRIIEVELSIPETLKGKTEKISKQKDIHNTPAEKSDHLTPAKNDLPLEATKEQNLEIDTTRRSSDISVIPISTTISNSTSNSSGRSGELPSGGSIGTDIDRGLGGSKYGNSDIVTDFPESEPEFDGNLESFLARSTRYPEKAIQEGVEGQVFVCFVVDEIGRVTKPEVVKGIGYGCDEEAIRVIKSLPNWKPGKMNGLPVKVRLRVPFHFRLAK